jgi:NADPH:quinone reductase-like Zn-dependent oxidoreductase
MKAAVLRAPGGLDRIEVQNIPDPGQPGPGQIRIALHATSLNYHDLLVANGGLPTADGRVLMSDGAGVVEAVGEGVAEFRLGDHVVSCFFLLPRSVGRRLPLPGQRRPFRQGRRRMVKPETPRGRASSPHESLANLGVPVICPLVKWSRRAI